LTKPAAPEEIHAFPVNASQAAALDNYVRGRCGYVESYIAKDKDLAAIKKKWEMVF